MTKATYRPEIDGLRAVAVGVVILYHAFPDVLPGGFVGVDVFFVISGFLITSIIASDLKSRSFSLVDFYKKRARRIFPALAAVMSACLMAGWFLMLADEFELLGKHILSGGLFVSNIVYYSESGYFDVSSQFKPLLHLWSLGIEEQFYIVWPIAIVVIAGLRLPFIALPVAAGGISFLISVYMTESDASGAYYLPYSRFWELLIGAGLALSPLSRSVHRIGAEAAGVAGVALIIGAAWIVRNDQGFPAPAGLAPTIGAALIIIAGKKSSVLRLLLANRVFVWIGLISYPLYLWHWPLLSFPSIVNGGEVSWQVKITAVSAAVILASATFYYIERPIRIHLSLRRSAFASSGFLFCIVACGMAVFLNGGAPDRPAISQVAAVQSEFEGSLWKYTTNDVCLDAYKLPDQEKYGWWFCVQNRAGSPEVLLLGNSYANHYYAGVVASSAFSDKVVLSLGSCDPAMIYEHEVVPVSESVSPCIPERRWNQQQLVDALIEDGNLELVIISGIAIEPTADYISRLRKRIGKAVLHGARVIVMTPHVKLGYDSKTCFGRPFGPTAQNCIVPSDEAQSLWAGLSNLFEEVHSFYPDVLFFDPNSAYCEAGACKYIYSGRPILRDEYSHFSETGSKLVVSKLMDWLISNHPDFL